MVARLHGQRTVSATRDEEGHREYKIVFLVETNDYNDGPAVVMNCPGLPLPGMVWDVGNDSDPWAYFRYDTDVKIHEEKEGDPAKWWRIEMKAGTKPVKSCKETEVEDPLLEPQKVSGKLKDQKIEQTTDRFGNPILTSSHEVIRGPQVEYEEGYNIIEVEQNVAVLDLAFLNAMKRTVNAFVLWGCAPRTVLFNNFTWEEKYHGQCYKYFTRKLELEINPKGWDIDILDEGNKVLQGEWDNVTKKTAWKPATIDGKLADPKNPSHFMVYKDNKQNPCKVILDGEGKPYVRPTTTLCNKCPMGAPKEWIVKVGALTFTLKHVGEEVCVWSEHGTLTIDQSALQVNLSSNNWEFICKDPYFEGTWIASVGSWKCDGSNVLVLKPGQSNNLPPVVTASSKGAGRIQRQIYNEADLLLLGIPPILGP